MRSIKKAAVSACCVMLIIAAAMTGCSSGTMEKSGQHDTNTAKKSVNLIYFTIGEPDKDLGIVNKAINKLLRKKLGITITYQKINWQSYDSKMLELVSSDTPFDIAYANNYATYAQKGAWLCLDDYLKNEGKQMYQAINPILWNGVRMMDGKIYGVPTNKELAVPEVWMYPSYIVKKYNININQYLTLESLEPVLKLIKEREPTYQAMELDKDSSNFFALYGYEYVTNRYLPLMVKSNAQNPKIVNIFETQVCRNILNTLRRYYKAGYINADAALRTSPSLEKGKKVFWRPASGGPYSEVTWSQQRGYQIVAKQVTDTVVTTESARGGVMAVNAKTEHPSECVKFLNLLNTDSDLRNLVNYGIEGVHYKLSGKGQIVLTDRSQNYSGVQYTQGNWFILKTLGGANADPLDKWNQYKAFNAQAVKSRVFGFTPNLEDYETEISNIRSVWDKYYSCLMTGSVDVDTELPKFQKELNDAGIRQIQNALQKQLDQWLKTNK